MNLPFEPFDDFCNCTYSTSNGENIKVSMSALIEVIKDIPEIPKILTMDINLIPFTVMTGNYIILSKPVADALEEAISCNKGKMNAPKTNQ